MMTKTLPADLQAEITALTELGLYANEKSVVADALRTFFSARPDLRLAVACRLYEKGLFSLGKAAEWSGLNLEELKDEFHRRGIERLTEDEPEAITAMARKAARLAGRPEPTW